MKLMDIVHNIEVQKEGYVKLRLEAPRSMSPKSKQAPPLFKEEDLRGVDTLPCSEYRENSEEGP